MIARNLITHEIPPLKTSDNGHKAMQWMDEFKVSHLPIVEQGEYIGLVSDSEILDLNDPDRPLSGFRLSLMRPYVFAHNHVYEMIRLVKNISLTVIPVLNEDNTYLGSVTLPRLVESFADIAGVNEPGGIIVLEINVNDYSLTQIAGIVEGNDAKITSLYLSSSSDTTRLQVVLKINRTDLSGILQTFNRYDYVVTASFHESEFMEDFKQRYDSFMNYLNI